MDAHARYMFDAVFASSAKGQAAKAEIPSHTDQALEAARDSAYQQGLVDGRAQANGEASSHLDQLVTQLLEMAQVANGNMAQASAKSAEQATRLALVASQTLVPALIAQEPECELMALFGECVAQLEGAPQLVIHVPAGSADDLKDRLDSAAANLVANNEIRLVADENMSDGDCRITWASGEISRDRRQLEDQINAIIERRYPSSTPKTATQQTATTADAAELENNEINQRTAHEGAPQ